jgi:ABC-type sugar transport system ATPase subunit
MIQLKQIHARFGDFELRDINLRVSPGEYCVLLGPPGSGKTSIIEIIAGLRPAVSGDVILDGLSVRRADPADRHVGYVPQDHALFPTLDVFGNIAFGLKVRHLPAGDIQRRVQDTAARLEIEHLLTRSCKGLSGGERQRVALGRALVLEPKVLLLDEPVASLDELTRQQVCMELRSLHDSLGITTIHVSHNFDETRLVADMVCVMRDGLIAQQGRVDEVFHKPVSPFVARFVQAGNVLEAVVKPVPSNDSACTVRIDDEEFDSVQNLPAGPASLLLRPIDATLGLADATAPPGYASLRGTVLAVNDSGGFQVTVRVAVGRQILSVAIIQPIGKPLEYRPGQAVTVMFNPANLLPLAQ